jgi:hypothetical protein
MTDNSPEFDLIARHFTRPAANAVLGVGDDCALVDITNGMDLAVSTDTMVSGTHFFPDVPQENLGHKALAVNLSDMATMGAMPYWPTLALPVPSVDHGWLAALPKFCASPVWRLAHRRRLRGPLSLTITTRARCPGGRASAGTGRRRATTCGFRQHRRRHAPRWRTAGRLVLGDDYHDGDAPLRADAARAWDRRFAGSPQLIDVPTASRRPAASAGLGVAPPSTSARSSLAHSARHFRGRG